MTGSGTTVVGGSGSGSGGSGGGGGTASYAEEAGHALEADHATSADTATEATHATSADTATSADSATTATTAQNLASDSTDWNKIADKTIVQSIAEVWTFAKGIISTLRSVFNGGINVSKASGDTNKALQVAGGTLTDTLGVSGATTLGTSLNVTGNTTMGGTLGVTGKVTGNEAEFQALAVTKSAHFQKLTVDELTSNKGALIITSANCVAELVGEDQSAWFIYFSRTDRDGNAVTNPWKVGDQAICLTFKAEGTGTFDNVKNRYYWRMVTGVYSDQTGPDGNTYHVIHLSKTVGDSSGTTVPAPGDNIVQLGYQGQTSAPERQTAVILSSYPTMDTGVKPPSLAFYKNINGFALTNCRWTYIDGVNNEFIGNFKILVNGSYTNLTTVLATMEGLLSVVQKTVIGKNIIPSEGWQDVAGNLLDSDTFIPSTQKLNAGTDDILYTPMMYLKEGTYIFSCYTDDADAEIYVYTSSTNKAKPNEMPWGESIHFDGVVSGDTYTPSGGSALPRRYATIEIQSDCYACLNIMDDVNDLIIYRPQLEEGSTATAWEIGNVEVRSSELKQTADLIRLQVGNCGLDLTNSKILAKTNKFEIQNTSGVKTFGVDADGNLESTGNASFKGTVKAENFYQAMTLVWNNRKVWVLDVDPTANHITYIWYHTLCTDSGFITYQNNALGQGNRYSVGDIIPYDQHYDSDDFFNPSGGAFGPVGIGNFLAYTNVSSIIEIVDDYQNLMLSGIAIPAAKDMPGKTITVKNRASNRPVNIYARSVDGSVAHQFYPRVDGYPSYDATYATETKQITSGTLDLYSDGTYWLII